MYGYQGNNSQSYNYQNPNGSSYGNIGQYTGHYSYYSSASTAYNTFPSNDQPCSSLGVLPQEYSQVGNGVPRPYYFDSNNSFPRPYQALPYNQSMDLPTANSFNSCPRNCHCCESINPKYFAASNSLQQQSNTQNICDSSLNASYNSIRKGLGSGRWRESSSQLSNIHDGNDSSSPWPMPKYGTSCKSEPCMWPLSQKQPTKFENTEHLATGNAYMLPQQHQRKPIPNNQTYSVLHSNSLLPVQTPRPPQGRSEELMGNCFTGYPYTSDYKKSIAEHAPYVKPHINKITPSRPTCNLSSNCEGGFPYKFSSPNTNVYHENQKCAIDSPKLVSQLPSALVESIQRRLPGSNVLDGTNGEMSYCQTGLISSVHSIDAPTRRTYSIPTESDPRILLNCGSSASNDMLPTSRFQLPAIHSLKPTSVVMNAPPPKDFCDDFSYNSPRSSKGNLDGSYRIPSARNMAQSNVSLRNLNAMNPEKVPDISSENACRIQSETESSCTLTNFMPNSRYAGKQFYLEPSSEFAEADNKLGICKDLPVKPSPSMSSNHVIGDLRHFLSTWDDGDDDESTSITSSVLPLGNDCTQEQLVREGNLQEECASVDHLQEKTDNACVDVCGNSNNYIVGPKEVPVNNAAYECANSHKVFNSTSESNSFHVNSNVIAGVDNRIVGDLGIPPKPCIELEHGAERIVMKSGINVLHAEQRSQVTYNQLGLSQQSNLNPQKLITNILEKSECSSSHIENPNNAAKSVKGRGEPSTSPCGKENEVNLEILNSSTSHVVSSGEMSDTSAKENQGEALQKPLDGIMGSREESCCKINVKRQIPDCKDSESPNNFTTNSGEDNPVPVAVGSLDICSFSSRLPKATNSLNDALSCDPSPGNLSSQKAEYPSDTFSWYNSESKDCTIEAKDNFVGNNPKTGKEKQANTKEIENDCILNDKIVMDHDLRVCEKCHDDCNQNDKHELGMKENIHQDSCNNGASEQVNIPIAELNTVLTGKSISNDPSEEVMGTVKKDSSASHTEKLISAPHVVQTVPEDLLNGEKCISLQRTSFGGVYNHHEGNQEQSKLEILNSMQSNENQACDVGSMCRDNSKLSLNQCDEISSRATCIKNKVGGKEISRRVLKKSSYITALLIRRKYCKMGLHIQKRATLAARRNGGDSWKSKLMSLVEQTNNMHSIENKCVENYSENQSCKRNIPNEIGTTEHQIICSEDKIEPGKGVLSVTSDLVESGEHLKFSDHLKNEDVTFKNTHSSYSEQIGLLGEGNEVAYPESEPGNEIPSGENNLGTLLSIEEREAQPVNFEGNCIIGNVEVFMGSVKEANSFEEEAVEGADVENVLHEDPCIQETSNLQYWCNYELGNDLGVAMEIEVGSEMYSTNSVELKQQVEGGTLSYDMSEKVGDSVEGEVIDHQGREKVLDKLTDDLINDVETADGNNKQSTFNEDCLSANVDDNEDTFICKKKTENGAVNFNCNISFSLVDSHPEKNSVVHISTIEDNTDQIVDVLGKNIDTEDVMRNCSQEANSLGVSLFPDTYSKSDINDTIMPEINCSHENSEEVETINQESKQHILSKESTLTMTSSKTKDITFHKRVKKYNKNIGNSTCSSNSRDLIKLHSILHSNKELQKEKNNVRTINLTSNLVQSEDDQKSAPMPSHDYATNSEKGEGIIILQKDVGFRDGAVNDDDSIEMSVSSRRSVPLQNDKSYKKKHQLSATATQRQMNSGSKNKGRHSSILNKIKSNQSHGVSDKIARKHPVKLKDIHKSSTIQAPVKESGAIIQQQELPNKVSIIKTKASLKSFDKLQLKSVNCPKFGFWKNRSRYHKRIFGQNLKKSTMQKNVLVPRHVIPQPSEHTLPKILQICSVPPPKPLSPLPVLGDGINSASEKFSTDVSQPSFKIENLEINVNENTEFHSSHSLLGVKYSSSSASLYPPQSESKLSQSHAIRSFCQATPEEDCVMANSVHSKPLSAIHSSTFNEQEMSIPEITTSKTQHEKDANDSGLFSTHPTEDSIPLIPEEAKVDSSWSMTNSCLVSKDSSSDASPHVRISFKKVLNGSKKNVWMKRPITDTPVKKQDIFPPGESKTIKRMSSTECESPLPKVTIKKKSGEKGYQSFLSGFSSASSSPSTSPTVQPKSSSPFHLLTNTEKPSTVKCNGALEESTADGLPVELFHTSLDSTEVNKSHDVENVEMSDNNSSVKHTFYTNVVEKKEGSGLVFVIRGLGSKIKECSIKDKDAELKSSSPVKDCGITDSNMQDTTACSTSVADDVWESGPWSVWQPVVKLFRSCELDHLALKLHSAHGDGEEKNTHDKLLDSQESPRSEPTVPGNELPSKPTQYPSQDKTKELGPKGKTFSERESCKNQYGEIILNRKGSHIDFGTNKVEFDMIMRECDRLNLPKKKPKPGNKFQSAHKPTVARNTHVLNASSSDVKCKVLIDRKERVSTECGTNKSLAEEALLVKGQVERTEKNHDGNESETNFNIPPKGTPTNEKIKVAGERTFSLENSILGNNNEGDKQGTKAKRKIESEGDASNRESVVKLTNSKILSSPGLKSLYVPSKSVPNKGWEEKVKHKAIRDNSGPEDASYIVREPVKEDLQSKSLKSENKSYAGPTNRSPYACEACCRTFSSKKWLSRHCSGESHSRVENAQRQAVQALLLLLTGNESHLLQPLTEKELSQLKKWPSHAVPSPLQLALNEFLNTT